MQKFSFKNSLITAMAILSGLTMFSKGFVRSFHTITRILPIQMEVNKQIFTRFN